MTRPVSAQAARFERRLTRLYAAARQAYLRQQFGRANAMSEEAEAVRRQYVARLHLAIMAAGAFAVGAMLATAVPAADWCVTRGGIPAFTKPANSDHWHRHGARPWEIG